MRRRGQRDMYLDLDSKPGMRALRNRYEAGITAVRAGADPYQTLWLVLHPTPDVEKASRGELPRGYTLRSDEEVRAMRNAEARRYAEPKNKKWAA
jgi:hypothetical protein